jgi:hypothetical protein
MFTKIGEPFEEPSFKNEWRQTKYTDRETHEKIGFHQDWGQCADQLVALVTKS